MTEPRAGEVSPAEWAGAQAIGESMRPRIRPTDKIVSVSGPADEQTRREAAALLGCDVADVHDVLAEARDAVQARIDE